MSDRTDRLLALHVVLLALLVVAQATVVPRNQLLGTVGLLVSTLVASCALAEFARAQ